MNYKPVPLWGYKIHLEKMNTASAVSMYSTMLTDVGTILTGVIPLILGVVAILIGLGYGVRLLTRKIGKKL